MRRKVTRQLNQPYPYVNVVEKDYLVEAVTEDGKTKYFIYSGEGEEKISCEISKLAEESDGLPKPFMEIKLSELAHVAGTENQLKLNIEADKQRIKAPNTRSEYYLIRDERDGDNSPLVSNFFTIYDRLNSSQRFIKIIDISSAAGAETKHSYFSDVDLDEGDIINFSIRLTDRSEAYAKVIWEQKVLDDITLEEKAIETSRIIKVSDGFFHWSFEDYGRTLGYRLTSNRKINKPFKLQIYKTLKDGKLSGFINNAIVTYTLLMFDD